MRRAVALLFLLGCSTPLEDVDVEVTTTLSSPMLALDLHQGWHIVIDPSVHPTKVDAIMQALREWRDSVPCPFVFDVTIAETPRFFGPWPASGTIDIHEGDVFPTEDETAVGYGEWYPNGGSRVGFKPSIRPEDVLRVARHELGHAFHLEHAERGVMYLHGQDGPVSESDVLSYAKEWCPR